MLSDFEQDVVDAFWFLSAGRNVGMEVCGLQMQEIESYMRVFRIREQEVFARLVRAADLAFLRHAQEASKADK